MPRKPATIPFDALLDAAPDAMVIIDRDGVITHVNQQAERLFGYPREAMLGSPVELLIPERFRAAHPLHRDRYFAEPHPRPMGAAGVALFGRRRDGTEFPAEVSLSPLESESGTLVIAAIRDGAIRQRIEERFRRLLEAAPDAMVIAGRDGRIILVNARAEALFGYARAELIGQEVELLLPERYRAAHPAHRRGYFSAPGTRPMGAGGLALFGRRKDGGEFPAEISLSPLETEGELVAIAAVRDISDRRKAEEERAKLVQAQEALRMRDEFLSVASHELRTPLAALQMQLDGMERARQLAPGDANARLPRQLARIRTGVTRLTTLVSQLLDLSRITAGKLALELEEVDLVRIVRDVMGEFQDEAERAGSTLSLRETGPVMATCDRSRLEQVVTNLLSNAIKYGEGKPVDLVVEDGGDGLARLSVRDHGIGIAPEHQARIFERFERLISARNYGGFGLGLWIVREVVEAHGGTIRVWSQPRAGSTFTVELPHRRADVAPPATGERAEARTRCLLLVDDDPLIRETFTEVLEAEGYTVACASNGLDALETLRALTPRLILLDLMMPVMDAWAFRAEQLKDPRLASIPVVVVSAVTDLERRAASLNPVGVLKKPPAIESLLALLSQHCPAS